MSVLEEAGWNEVATRDVDRVIELSALFRVVRMMMRKWYRLQNTTRYKYSIDLPSIQRFPIIKIDTIFVSGSNLKPIPFPYHHPHDADKIVSLNDLDKKIADTRFRRQTIFSCSHQSNILQSSRTILYLYLVVF